jgi:predicted house-cleaning NTP pyrophosphatase (Maf/HAM1 superfamily)
VTRLVLASSSPARYSLLKAAGIDPEVVVPTADEQALSDQFKATNPNHSTAELVQYLADAKAKSVVGLPETSGALVLGGDEWTAQKINVKNLDTGLEEKVDISQVLSYVSGNPS